MSRVQLALNVSDLEKSIEFYSTLFGVEPHKRRPGYANFAIAEPPLKLVLIEVPETERGTGVSGALNHLGIEVQSTDEVHASAEHLESAGLATFDERDTTCCFALQDKVWVQDPAGAPWEVYTIKDDNPVEVRDAFDRPILLSNDACCIPSNDAGATASSSIGLIPLTSES